MVKTPTQQALIQFLESILITALIAGVVSISPLVAGSGPLNFSQILVSFGLAVAFSLAHSLATYLKASPPPQQSGQINLSALGTILDDFFTTVQQRLDAMYAAAPQRQPAAQVAQPVHGPAGVVAASVQPAQSAVQASIPAFASTAEIAAVKPPEPFAHPA